MPLKTTAGKDRNFRDYKDLKICGKGESYREVTKNAKSARIWQRFVALLWQPANVNDLNKLR
jgi:hypothetical protein